MDWENAIPLVLVAAVEVFMLLCMISAIKSLKIRRVNGFDGLTEMTVAMLVIFQMMLFLASAYDVYNGWESGIVVIWVLVLIVAMLFGLVELFRSDKEAPKGDSTGFAMHSRGNLYFKDTLAPRAIAGVRGILYESAEAECSETVQTGWGDLVVEAKFTAQQNAVPGNIKAEAEAAFRYYLLKLIHNSVSNTWKGESGAIDDVIVDLSKNLKAAAEFFENEQVNTEYHVKVRLFLPDRNYLLYQTEGF